MLRNIALWIDERLLVSKLFAETAGHTVPTSANSWFYVFGSATLLCFLLQIVSGICLALVYIPSAQEAYASLQYLNYQQPLGWYLRAVHYWGSNFMVAIMLLHMTQVFLFGAFKFPRELTWISGCFLLVCTLGMAFTGQVLRFDQDAYWGLGIGASITGRIPLIGGNLVHLLLAGPIIAGETLSRFFTFHVFIIPGLIIALVSLHLRLVLTKGINEYPVPGLLVKKETYEDEYQSRLRTEGAPFYPTMMSKDLIFGALVLLGVLGCAAYFGPVGPRGAPDPTLIDTTPRPDFFFLWLFSALALLPPYLETFLLLTAPVVLILILFVLPFLSGTGEKSPRRRPVAILATMLAFMTFATLTYLGVSAPWSPHMNAWSGDPVPLQYIHGRSGLELQGALVLQNKQCRNCHSLGGSGGQRGPALDTVATRLTHDQLVRQVIQGGGNMPAYGKNLTPQEVTALTAFLQTLGQASEPVGQEASAPATSGALPRSD